MMDANTENKLEKAVSRWVAGVDMDTLVEMVNDQMWQYYRKSADLEEVLAFIDDMGVTDKDVEQ
jgi:hypothetical protein